MLRTLFTKTVLGGGVALLGWLSRPEVLALMPEKYSAVVVGTGLFLTLIGARHAYAKQGRV